MKKILSRAWHGLILATIVSVLVVNGCNSNGPTTPSIPDQHENMKEEPAYSTDFWAAVEEGSFKINIPRSGDYKVLYTTNLGKFDILFRLSSRSLVTVELIPGNVVEEVILQRGTITLNSSQAIEMFDDAEFTMDADFGNLLLIGGGASVQSRPTPTPTPTPAPIPTANPLPNVLPQPSADAKVVVALGDSLTYGLGSSVGGYPTYLEVKLLENGYDVDVVNEGVPGDWAYETAAIFQRAVQGADAVLLMVGTNDIVNGDCYGRTCNLIDEIGSMIDQALSQGIPIFVSTIIAANSSDIYGDINGAIRNANTQIKALAASKGVRVVDNYEAIEDSGGDPYYDDRLHLNDAGYEIMANIWYRNIRNRF